MTTAVIGQDETIPLIREVTKAFQSREEFALLEQMEKAKQEISEIYEKKEKEYLGLIEGY